MHFKIRVGDFIEAIRIAQRGVNKASQSTLLEGILFDAKENSITLYTTDLKISLKTSVECEVLKEGRYVLNSNMISDIVSKLKSDDILDLEVGEDKNARVRSGRTRINFVALEASDFPDFPEISEDFNVDLKGSVLKELISKTRVSVSQDENRLIYTGVKFCLGLGEITAVSLDGYRVSVVNKEISSNIRESFIIPSNALNEVEKLIKDDEDIKIVKGKNHAMIYFSNSILYTRLFEGDFFNYETLISKESKTEVIVLKDEFKNCLDRSMIVAKTNLNMVKLDIKEDNMNIKSQGNLGETSDDIDISKKGEDLVIGFNPRYLKEGVSLFSDDKIRLAFSDDASPVTIYPTAEEGLMYILLPVRLSK